MAKPTLWYFADPMCSWCWGFTSVMEGLKSTYDEQLNIALILGGLQPGTTTPMSEQSREEILHHWHEVHAMTGQSFQFDGAMPPGFIYNTEPPSRAVVTMSEASSEHIFDLYKAIQSAFYTQNIDVTQTDELVKLAMGFGVEGEAFRQQFESEAMRQKTQLHFAHTRKAGIRGFPTLFLQMGDTGVLLASGYRPFDELKAEIDSHLAAEH